LDVGYRKSDEKSVRENLTHKKIDWALEEISRFQRKSRDSCGSLRPEWCGKEGMTIQGARSRLYIFMDTDRYPGR
jgi:hypothetical protein